MSRPQGEKPVNERAAGDSGQLERVLELVRFLRANCPWDAAQTHRSLVPYLLEEAHEVAEAIEAMPAGEPAEPSSGAAAPAEGGARPRATLVAELGDLLLNVAFQIVLAEERGAFTAAEVVSTVEAKMRRRHPHLYGEGEAAAWEELKRRERAMKQDERERVLEGLASTLDPLSRAHRIQDRVAAVGFDWDSAHGAFEKVAEELEEVRRALEEEPSPALEEELGDLLFAAVNLTRLSGVHALSALRRANRKFTTRFERLEMLARERGVILGEASLEELDALWDEIKESEG